MKFTKLSWLKASPVIFLVTWSVPGAPGPQKSGQTVIPYDLIEKMIYLEAKHLEVVVKLKNRDSVRGYVGEVSRKSFVLQEKHGLMLIEYEEVASVKERIGLRRILRGIADAAFMGASYALWLPFQGISYLLTGEGLPDC